MKNFNHVIKDINQLKNFLESQQIYVNIKKSKSILVQVYTSQTDLKWISDINQVIEKKMPSAVVIGSTSAGEIVEGRLMTGKAVVSISFFKSSLVRPIVISCSQGNEIRSGQYLSQAIDETGSDIAGVLLFATPLSIDVSKLFSVMSLKSNNYPMFGGGAGAYTPISDSSPSNSVVFCGENYLKNGVVAVVFTGKDLHICSYAHLGWHPLSKEMTITESDGVMVKKIDDVSAFEIYKRYLQIKNDDEFFLNVLQFPLLLERNGQTIARMPLSVGQNGSIEFYADLNVGEKIRIGYGNPETIVKNAREMGKVVNSFAPDAIFLFNCVCHRFLMQNDVDNETQLFNSIAPTTGFYTNGEFYSNNNKIQVQNSTMVVVCMREGEKHEKPYKVDNIYINNKEKQEFIDPYANKHSLIVSRLIHFIGVVTSELEQANKELTRISEIDKLTQIYNRLKLDIILDDELKKCELYHTEFSLIMMDVDIFKQVNDIYGHVVGDTVLVKIADIISKSIRKTDSVGRWGGEEFMFILPLTNLDEAGIVAEKIRYAIDLYEFPITKHQTCSFGVTAFLSGDSQDKMLSRADKALYEAKACGRNKVKLKA